MKEAYIRFMAPIDVDHATALLRILDMRMRQRVERIHLLMSSPGGSVFHGMSICNYLRGAPFEVFTYNFGSVDSVGVVVFCAGKRRFCVPHARFLLHGVQCQFTQPVSLDDRTLEERLKGLQIDQFNIARVIADTCGKSVEEVTASMTARTGLKPEEAREYGLVHEIKPDLVPADAELDVVYETIGPRQGVLVPGPPAAPPAIPGQTVRAVGPLAPVPPGAQPPSPPPGLVPGAPG